MNLCQVIPRIGGLGCGVGDYALLLGAELEARQGIRSENWVVEMGLERVRERVVRMECRAAVLIEALHDQNTVFLHYVGYGYQKRGCPVWLLRGLEAWKRKNPNARLVTMFHELYASGMPWQSSFWTSPLQRWICRDLARLSDGIVTNREGSALILKRMTGRDDVCNLPVFSNMGEPDERTPVEGREPWVVLFGGKEWRTTALLKDREEIVAACRKWGIEKVVEIGAGETPEIDLGLPTQRLGRLPAEEVSAWLSRCRLGVVSYPSSYLEKSGIYAAYAAHGVVPVLPQRSLVRETLGVVEGRHYTSATTGEDSTAFLEQLSHDVFGWYQGHKVSEHARTFAKLVQR